jgi:hypothetical protein
MSAETILGQWRKGRDTLRLVRAPEWHEWIEPRSEWEPGWGRSEPTEFFLLWVELGVELYVGEDETEARRIASEHLGRRG